MSYKCHLKEILCIVRLWDEVVDELGKESCKYFLLKKFTSAEYISGNGEKATSLWHYNISKTSSETVVKSRKRFFPAQLVSYSL